ncbi:MULTISPECIES: NAD(P)H-binding protein [Micromonospora]|uniref:NAD(P)H-binding protein n=1 Tax=Micromonospora TaxID=1873 RepID=UPI0021052CC4|nr:MULTISPECIES: NAD(P)H-binding protein [Micromonospora]
MQLTIFGASGGIGRHVVDRALAAGHNVTAVVRDPARLPGTAARLVTADLADRAALRAAVDGADAVLSGLGPVPRPTPAWRPGAPGRSPRRWPERAYDGSSWSAPPRWAWCRHRAGPTRRGATRATVR